MYKILGSIFLSLNFLFAGSITATIDSTDVVEGDSVLLTLAVTGKNTDIIPDIEEINGHKVFNTQRRSATNFVHVNGVTSMEKTEMLMLEFRPKTDMTIPAFSVQVDGKVEKTTPIKIKVLKSTTGMKRATKDFSLDIKVSKSKFYLGESIVLSLYFKQRTNIEVMQIEYTPPTFKDFFSKQIGDGKTYKKGAFTIQELTYLLIAKKAGKLTLEPARVKIAQRSRQRQSGGWYVDVPKWTNIASSALYLDVIEPKQKHDIVGQYKLHDKIDHQKVKANKPVTLRIELMGTGTLDDYDGLNFDIPSVTIYSDDAKIESTLMGKKLQSRYQKSFVFISDHNFTIPSKEIRVYDYATAQVKVLKTKEYHIEVEQSKAMASTMVHSQTGLPTVVNSLSSNVPWYKNLPSLGALVLAFILGVLATLSVKFLPTVMFPKWKIGKGSSTNDEALKVLYPKIGESAEVERMVRRLYAQKNGNKSVKINKNVLKMMVEKYK